MATYYKSSGSNVSWRS
ncbi:BnaA07g03620D [Brassica napus]|uniref:BnaA07g03620D protein n=1 Tax=Brassica napus TaxID=3708 RepID=A0A078IAI9_BRANA|nr:BnaA07g03620D [Brassica napus]